MTDNNLSAKFGADTTDFKAGIASINREIRVIESGFRASAAALGDWGNSASGLEMRTKSLTATIGLQQQKVQALQAEYKKIVAEKGADSRAAQDLEIRINKETEALNKNQVELKQTNDNLKKLASESNATASGMDKLGKESDQAAASVEKSGNKARESSGKFDVLKKSLSGLTTAVKATVAATAAMAAGLGVALGATIGPASDLNETVSKVGVVFGTSATSVLGFGETASAALGMSKQAALSAAGTYGNLFVSMGMTTSKAADMSTNIVSLAGDLASFNNMDPTEVLDKLRAGLTGESEPLKALGVNINQAAIEAKALEMGLAPAWTNTLKISEAQIKVEKSTKAAAEAVKKYGANSIQAREASNSLMAAKIKLTEAQQEETGELDAAAKAQATYALILEQTKTAQGDFSRTSTGLANQSRIIKATFQDISANIGTLLLPAVGEVAITASGYLSEFSNVVKNANGDIGKIASGAGDMVAKIAQGIASGLPALLDSGLKIIQSILNSIIQNLPALIDSGIKIIMSLVNFLIQAAPQLLQAGIQIIQALISGILPQLPQLVDTGLKIVVELLNGLTAALPGMIPVVVDVIMQIVDVLIANLPLLIDAGSKINLALLDGFIKELPKLIAYAPVFTKSFFEALIKSLPQMEKAGQSMTKILMDGFSASLAQYMTVANQTIAEFITPIVSSLSENVTTFMANIGATFINGLQGIRDSIVSIDIFQYLSGAIDAFANQKWFLFGQWLRLIWDKVWDGITGALAVAWGSITTITSSAWDNLQKSVSTAWTNTTKFLQSIDLGKMASDVWSQFTQGVDENLRRTGSTISDRWGEATNLLKNVNLFDIGANIIKGLIDGMKSLLGTLTNTATDISKVIKDVISGFFSIRSPSRVMFDIGGNLGQGLAEGMLSTKSVLKSATTHISESIKGDVVPASSGAAGNNTAIQMGGVHITIYGAADSQTVSRAAETGVLRALRAKGAA